MAEHLIYLAAGSARRFGSNKLLCPVDGKPLFQHGLDTLARAVRQREDCTLTVVSRYPQILAAAQAAGGTAVDCPDSVLGLSYTIRAALEKHGFALESVCDGESFGPLTDESERYFFCAVKQYTQLEEQ